MKEEIIQEFPKVSIFRDVVPIEKCEEFISKYENDMYPYAGLESREQSYGQITEEIEQRSISEETKDEDRAYLFSKISEFLNIPYRNIEAGDIYVYNTGQYFGLHHDYPYDLTPYPYYANGGDRCATVIFWFNDDYEGGRLWFPKHNLLIEPQKGSAVYFEYDYPDEAVNESTIHESLPVTKGKKWISACFISNGKQYD